MSHELTCRRVAAHEPELAPTLEVMRELRAHLDPAGARERVLRQEREHGYELHACFREGRPIAAAGLRPLCTLARGPHLHLDDLVVTASERGSGAGAALLAHVEAVARARGLLAVFLDARPEAVGFYRRQGYEAHPAPVHKKRLE